MIESPIKTRRKAKGLSQGDVALLINISPFYIHRWEKGHALPCEKRIIQLAEIFGITPKTLKEELDEFYEARGNELRKLLGVGQDISRL